jgi:hypothetical protein
MYDPEFILSDYSSNCNDFPPHLKSNHLSSANQIRTMAFQTYSAVKTGTGGINTHGTSLCLFRQVAIRVEPNCKSVITVENIINSHDKHLQLIINGYFWLGANRSHIIRINRPEIVFQIVPSVTDHNSVITLKEQTGSSGAALSGACPAPHGLSDKVGASAASIRPKQGGCDRTIAGCSRAASSLRFFGWHSPLSGCIGLKQHKK